MKDGNQIEALEALGPLDGRYRAQCTSLRVSFSEAALIRNRVGVELQYLFQLLAFLELEAPDVDAQQQLLEWGENLTAQDLLRAKEIESETKHDVKAVEYFVREQLEKASLGQWAPWVHWGLTSEDVDNLAYGRMLQQAQEEVLLPAQTRLLQTLLQWARRYADSVMPARTHGQIAVPTTMGKECVVIASRAAFWLEKLGRHRFAGKLNGAVGNYNAYYQLFPQRDWIAFSARFIESLGLQPTPVTTQIEPALQLLHFLDLLRQVNQVWLNLARDCWLYIALGYLRQAPPGGEVGSSTMPHKVNPIRFENAEGNLLLSNSLVQGLSTQLATTRLQRDLSDKTIKRNVGVALGHGLVAVHSLCDALDRVEPDEALMREEVRAHPEVMSEALQLLLRAQGEKDAFAWVHQILQTQNVAWENLLQGLPEDVQDVAGDWCPERYVGVAQRLTVEEVDRIERLLALE